MGFLDKIFRRHRQQNDAADDAVACEYSLIIFVKSKEELSFEQKSKIADVVAQGILSNIKMSTIVKTVMDEAGIRSPIMIEQRGNVIDVTIL